MKGTLYLFSGFFGDRSAQVSVTGLETGQYRIKDLYEDGRAVVVGQREWEAMTFIEDAA